MQDIIKNIKQEILIGNYVVLSSGSIIIHESVDSEFIFSNLRFVVSFDTELDSVGAVGPGRFTSVVELDDDGNEYLKLTLYNQSDSMFSSYSKMIDVATLHDHKLYLKFCVNSINTNGSAKEDKIFFYTWLLEK